ncbi:MAG: oxaloacetate decarboxylase subunit alpha [Oscillospiraceae bacterium]|nr:oxaloacetate decarboxylase subunit alpha [Oscillospiraceae bacterium]MDD4368628.1 oxaloacetate decarboxylase subunit alpha [Oscillospiraceae bacterium]
MANVKITETILRDAHQSLAATRMTYQMMEPALPYLDQVGYNALECWGGATFDACVRFLHEDPWERLRKIRKACPHTKLQMLLRGQNLLGYKHYADDVVDEFVKASVANGIDIIRIFDALNDYRNIERAMNATIKAGAHAQGCISYTTSPYHSLEKFTRDCKQLEEMGAASICIKDMAGLLLPKDAYELVKAIKETVKVPIELHTHYTTGQGSMAYLKAIEAGCDIIDTALSPLAMGTSQPCTEAMVKALEGTEFDTGLNLDKMIPATEIFQKVREDWIQSGQISPKVLGVNINALRYQVPGGMLSNLVSQLKQAGKEDQLEAVLEEVPRVRKDFGYPPLVTPSSQIVGTQAVMNVVTGERYKMVPNESKDILRGKYGRTPAPIDPAFIRSVLGDEQPITVRPADLLEPELGHVRQEAAEYAESDEDVLTYAMFPQVAETYFRWRLEQKHKLDNTVGSIDEVIQPV